MATFTNPTVQKLRYPAQQIAPSVTATGGGSAPIPNQRPQSGPVPLAPTKPAALDRTAGLSGMYQDLQSRMQSNLPYKPNNGNPQGANNMPRFGQAPTPERRAYLNNVSGQQSDLGRYRPPTLAGNGNDPLNWNDYGGYDYNLPSAYGPVPNSPYSQGPYGGYPTYLRPNWMNGAGSGPVPNSGMNYAGGDPNFYARQPRPRDPLLFPGGG